MAEATPKTVIEYQQLDGSIPFRDWLTGLSDRSAQARIDARVARVRSGNLGVVKEVGGGVAELKVDVGPGYRVYIGQYGGEIVVLLAGGDKATQVKDIDNAKSYWSDFKSRNAASKAKVSKARRRRR